ncbi:MAG: helix-turn-helix domain-containing protein [Nitrososphaera sp.]
MSKSSFRAWRRMLLMQRAAAELLANSDNRVKQLAIDFGYSSTKAFSRSFKECFGEPPSRYRLRLLPPNATKPSRKVSSTNGN